MFGKTIGHRWMLWGAVTSFIAIVAWILTKDFYFAAVTANSLLVLGVHILGAPLEQWLKARQIEDIARSNSKICLLGAPEEAPYCGLNIQHIWDRVSLQRALAARLKLREIERFVTEHRTNALAYAFVAFLVGTVGYLLKANQVAEAHKLVYLIIVLVGFWLPTIVKMLFLRHQCEGVIN